MFRGKRSHILILTLLGFVAVCGHRGRADESPKSADAGRFKTLTSQLGAASWAVREQATTELLQSGEDALPALAAVLNSSDAEVRARARRIHAHIDTESYQQRVHEFAADADGRQQLSLPGWQRFRKQIGEDAISRKLFVSMARVARPILESIEAGPAEVGKQIDDELPAIRKTAALNLREVQESKTTASIAAWIFAVGDSNVPLSEEDAVGISQLSLCESSMAAFAKSEQTPALRKIWGSWVGREFGSESLREQTQILRLLAGLTFSLPEGLPLAESVFKQANPPRSLVRSLAVLTIGKCGSKNHVEVLAPLLNDTDNWLAADGNATFRIGGSIQVRDLALAMSVYLSGRNPRDFGFRTPEKAEDMFPQFKHFQNDVNRVFDLKNSARRDAALKKWSATLALEKATAAGDQVGIDAAKAEIAAADKLLPSLPAANIVPPAE